MNPGVLTIKNQRVAFFAVILILFGGVLAYQRLGRLEDPEFTIKEALIITPYPGASAEEVAKEVTNPIESAVQQLDQLMRVESESARGRSLVSARIRDEFGQDRIPQVWDELRRKVNDVQSRLPPAVRGRSIVIDDFGDVYGIFFAITGDGYTSTELRRYAEFLRRELMTVPDVKKVDLFGEQQEVVYLEISRQRLAQLGIPEERVYAQLRDRNVAADGGRFRIGDEHIAIDPAGTFESAEAMLDLVIGSDATGRQLLLKDVATITRGDQDPPRRLLRFDGKPAIGLGISTVQGGNVVTMGNGIRKRLAELDSERPVGIEIGEINFQPDAVTAATNDFVFNIIKAVSIVFVMLLIAMGLRAGTIIGAVLLLTILGTIVVMYGADILMERISLGAFIIALCMLTDNAIIVTEGIKVRIEAGEDKLAVVRDVVAKDQWPLFGATAIAVIAFAAIGLSEDNTGEYCNSLFWVIFISLTISWVAAITITPLFGYLAFRPKATPAGAAPASEASAYDGWFYRGYRSMLAVALKARWLVLAASVGALVASVYGFRAVTQSFFPPATRPQFMVDAYLPGGTHIRETEAFAAEIESFIAKQPGTKHISSFVGSGALRFLLVYTPERENRAFVQFLVNVDDEAAIDPMIAAVQAHIDANYPNANAIAKRFLLGPGAGGRVQARFRGPDADVLRGLADQAKSILHDDGGALCIRHDWREREKVVRPELLESQARRNGITRVDVAQAIETSFEGRIVGTYREPGGAGTGLYAQETRLLPIVARPPLEERGSIDAIASAQIWSPAAGRMIPLSQVTAGTEVAWEDPLIARRDRVSTITVHADPRTGLPSQLFNRVRDKIEAIPLPPGYTFEWGGEHEDSTRARKALAEPLPLALTLMVFIVVCLFNSFRATAAVWLVLPMAIIGVTIGFLATGQPFGFMALLGVLSLGGELVKTSIIIVGRIKGEIDKGAKPWDAILQGSSSKVRPVLMIALTTVFGMIPLLQDPFFVGMAVTIMFGLSFCCILVLIVVPVLYAILYRVDEHTPAKAA
ncbi:MAG: efflux RND transporter permease subunit [Phycisphaerales bacterium]